MRRTILILAVASMVFVGMSGVASAGDVSTDACTYSGFGDVQPNCGGGGGGGDDGGDDDDDDVGSCSIGGVSTSDCTY